MRVLAVTNIYPTADHPASGPFVKDQVASLRAIGVEVEVFFVDRLRHGVRVYLGLDRQIRARVRESQPDLVHCMYGGFLAAAVTRVVRDRPTVVTFHGSDLLGEPLSGRARQVIARLGVRASLLAAGRASGVVVVSRTLSERLEGRAHPRRSAMIPCGVDTRRFRPLDRASCRRLLGWDPSRFHVLFPANNGNAIKRPTLAQLAVEEARRRGVSATLQYLQNVAHEQVPIWLNASDVVLLTSLHEGSPMIVKEALACRVPVVSVDVGDVRERIGGIEGCHVAEASPPHLAAKLAAVSAGPRRLAEASVILDLSLERTAERLYRFYRDLVGDPHAVTEAWREAGRLPWRAYWISTRRLLGGAGRGVPGRNSNAPIS